MKQNEQIKKNERNVGFMQTLIRLFKEEQKKINPFCKQIDTSTNL